MTTIEVPLINDFVVEDSESIELTLTEVTEGSASIRIADSNEATLEILDDDFAFVAISADVDTIAEPDDNVPITVSLSLPSDMPTVVSYVVRGTASSIDDFAELPGSITIPATSVSATFSVDILDDQIVEGNETLEFILTGITEGNRSDLYLL